MSRDRRLAIEAIEAGRADPEDFGAPMLGVTDPQSAETALSAAIDRIEAAIDWRHGDDEAIARDLALIRAALPASTESETAHPFKDEWSFQRSMSRGNPMAGKPIASDQPCFKCGVPFAEHPSSTESEAPGLRRLRAIEAAAQHLVNLAQDNWTHDSEQAAWAALRAALTGESVAAGETYHAVLPDATGAILGPNTRDGTAEWPVAGETE